MNRREREKLRGLLVARQKALVEEAPAEVEPTRADPHALGLDEDAQPLAEMSQSIASSRNRERDRSLRLIQAALQRLDQDPASFGLCRTCEEEIPPRRLQLMPWAELCVECQGRRDGARGGGRKHLTDFVD